jgi:GNAT superfamily N-acetyltransferase
LQTRPATLADLNLLVDLGRRTFYDTFVGACSEEDMQLFLDTSYAPAKLEQELRDPLSRFLILEEAALPLGYSRLMGESTIRVELVRFYLVQQAIGTGAAHVLMTATLDLARQLGYREIYLGVWEKNYRAQRFYEKWGFQKTGEKIFPVGNDPQIDWQYERTL